jgi:hypothetical protein
MPPQQRTCGTPTPEEPPNQPEGTMPPQQEAQQKNEETFKQEFAPGARIEYQGDEYLVMRFDNDIAFGIPLAREESFSLAEWEEELVEIDTEPTIKIPHKTTYPAQVFILAWLDDDGRPNAQAFNGLESLKEHSGSIDPDSVMEAISDPGTPIAMGDDRTITFAGIEGTNQ